MFEQNNTLEIPGIQGISADLANYGLGHEAGPGLGRWGYGVGGGLLALSGRFGTVPFRSAASTRLPCPAARPYGPCPLPPPPSHEPDVGLALSLLVLPPLPC